MIPVDEAAPAVEGTLEVGRATRFSGGALTAMRPPLTGRRARASLSPALQAVCRQAESMLWSLYFRQEDSAAEVRRLPRLSLGGRLSRPPTRAPSPCLLQRCLPAHSCTQPHLAAPRNPATGAARHLHTRGAAPVPAACQAELRGLAAAVCHRGRRQDCGGSGRRPGGAHHILSPLQVTPGLRMLLARLLRAAAPPQALARPAAAAAASSSSSRRPPGGGGGGAAAASACRLPRTPQAVCPPGGPAAGARLAERPQGVPDDRARRVQLAGAVILWRAGGLGRRGGAGSHGRAAGGPLPCPQPHTNPRRLRPCETSGR